MEMDSDVANNAQNLLSVVFQPWPQKNRVAVGPSLASAVED
jgi:hypothetical protein